jgi:hypothetical protein
VLKGLKSYCVCTGVKLCQFAYQIVFVLETLSAEINEQNNVVFSFEWVLHRYGSVNYAVLTLLYCSQYHDSI